MAELQPLRALRYDLDRAGPLPDLVAPPYDVIDPEQRARLAGASPYNVVRLDLPEGDPDPYAHAAELLDAWRRERIVVRDAEPALWALEQEYRGPDGAARTRRGVLGRIRVQPYGPGRVRPHERTHPGPREDRLRLTRATRANLSPIFALHDDPGHAAWGALAAHATGRPWGEVVDPEGTTHRVWRVTDAAALVQAAAAVAEAELLIADGHHRYETARVYAEEVGGAGAAGTVLACLVALQDPGLTVFPTHRLLRGLDTAARERLRDAILEHFEVAEVGLDDLAPPAPDPDAPLALGYLDAFHRRPLRLTLRDSAAVDAALPDASAAYRRLDTAVVEALLLKGALGLSDEDIAHLHGLGYARSDAEARELVQAGTYEAALFLAPTPVEQVQAVAAAGESMPPKSTFFYPKLLTGLLFNPLTEG